MVQWNVYLPLNGIALLVILLPLSAAAGAEPIAPAIFVFGDSIVDPGNNNNIDTIIKCNFPPYGQDFTNHEATGRFSNGLIPTDLMASKLGIKQLVPPYLGYEHTPDDILTGVSFASGATGFDPLTPTILNVIPMPDQLTRFMEYKGTLEAIAGKEGAARIVRDAIYIVCAGTDDIANTYYSTPLRSPHYDVPSYIDLLLSGATTFIRQLHDLGAQKIGFIGLPPIGCVPSQRTLAGGMERQCDQARNDAAMMYNSKIEAVIASLAKEPGFTGAKVIYLDIYTITNDMVQNPENYGFDESTLGCCGTGLIEVTPLCNEYTPSVCPDVNKNVFWDSYHPTERAYRIIVDDLYDRYVRQLLQ